MKKTLAVLLSVIMLFTAAAVSPASAATLGEDMTFGHISEYKDFCDRYGGAVDAVARAVYRLETDINIAEYEIPADAAKQNIKTLLAAVQHTHPELFYVSSSFRYRNTTLSDGTRCLHSVILHWGRLLFDDNGSPVLDSSGRQVEELYTDEQVLQMRARFRERAQWYLDLVDDSMSDFEKALVLHDALAINASYLISGEIYELMVNNRGKCYGYSECYSYLLAQVGIDSEIVESEDMFHQWNKVKLDGKYYHVDVTWDDPTPDSPGFAKHVFFLLSDAEVENGSNKRAHTGYVTDYPSDDTRFDNRSFHRFDTQLCRVGGKIYAVDNAFPGSSDTPKQLLTYDPVTDTSQTVISFADERWYLPSGAYWTSMFMALQEQDGFLYMNTANAVMVYDTQTGALSVFAENTFDQKFFGVRVIDGKVYGVLADSPSETGTPEYLGDCLVRAEPTTEPTQPTEPPTEPTQPTEPPTEPTEPTQPTEPTTEPPVVEDTYLVVGAPVSVFGTEWDDTNAANRMTLNDQGVYEKTFSVSRAMNDIRFMLVINGEWYGDENGDSYVLHMTGAGTFTILADPESDTLQVVGDNVSLTPSFLYDSVTVIGNGEGRWLFGEDWNPSAEANRMHEVAEDVWEISFSGITDAFDRQIRFALDGTTAFTFGGRFADSGTVSDAVPNGGAITFDTEYERQTVKLRLDLSGYDCATGTGATFTVLITPEVLPGDLDGDGQVTINDATLLLSYLAEFEELTDEQLLSADVNGDGKVNVRDVTKIQRIVAELE